MSISKINFNFNVKKQLLELIFDSITEVEVDKSTELVVDSNELLQKTHPYFYIRMGKIAMKKKLLVSK